MSKRRLLVAATAAMLGTHLFAPTPASATSAGAGTAVLEFQVNPPLSVPVIGIPGPHNFVFHSIVCVDSRVDTAVPVASAGAGCVLQGIGMFVPPAGCALATGPVQGALTASDGSIVEFDGQIAWAPQGFAITGNARRPGQTSPTGQFFYGGQAQPDERNPLNGRNCLTGEDGIITEGVFGYTVNP